MLLELSINFSRLIWAFLPLFKTGYKIFTEKKGLSYVSFQVWEFVFLSKENSPFLFLSCFSFSFSQSLSIMGRLTSSFFYSYDLCAILLCRQTAFFKNVLQTTTVTNSICFTWHFSFRWSIFDSPQVIEISEP